MNSLQIVRDRLASAQKVLFVTGAGVSAESGLPTYRGLGGLYEVDTTADHVPIEVALSGPMFRRNPDLTWRYIRQIEEACRGAEPNAGHHAIAALEARMQVTVLTQNVDGLHTDAGSTDVIEIHGNLRILDCTRCPWTHAVSDYSSLSLDCPRCGAMIRPRVVLFEEALPEEASKRLHTAMLTDFDAVFTVGTTSVFPYIAAPVRYASFSVEINPGDTAVSHLVTHRIRAGAAETLVALCS